MNVEKAIVNKSRKERVAYVDMDDDDLWLDVEYNHIEGNEVDLTELKPRHPYVYKLLTPSNEKNHAEPKKSDKFLKKTYTFHVTMCDEIFDLLVADGQILVPHGAKVPPLEQRKKRSL